MHLEAEVDFKLLTVTGNGENCFKLWLSEINKTFQIKILKPFIKGTVNFL
jgi:hypothetical protein